MEATTFEGKAKVAPKRFMLLREEMWNLLPPAGRGETRMESPKLLRITWPMTVRVKDRILAVESSLLVDETERKISFSYYNGDHYLREFSARLTEFGEVDFKNGAAEQQFLRFVASVDVFHPQSDMEKILNEPSKRQNSAPRGFLARLMGARAA